MLDSMDGSRTTLSSWLDVRAWLEDVLNSLKEHDCKPITRIAQARSGHTKGQSGLTAEEAAARSWREEAQWNYNWAKFIAEQVGDKRPQERGWGGTHHCTRAWRDLNWGEQWWVQQLRSGTLMRELQAARQAHGGRVEAPPFTIVNAPQASTTSRLRSRSPRRSRRRDRAASAAPVASTLLAASSRQESHKEHYSRKMETELIDFKVFLEKWKAKPATINAKAFK